MNCKALIEQLLADHILERLRAARACWPCSSPMAQTASAACARALAHDSPYYRTVKTILSSGADLRADTPPATPSGYGRTRFTRAAAELFPHPQQDLLH